MDNKSLPPLPPSDGPSLQRNQYDGFYDTRAREFWGRNEVTQNEVKPFQKCDHFFSQTPDGVTCAVCHAGWVGPLVAKEGKLFVNGNSITIT